MRIFIFLLMTILLFCSSTLRGQSEVISIQDTILKAIVQFSVGQDSTIVRDGAVYEYFTISSPKLIPTLQNYDDIYIRIKTINNFKTIKQYLLNGNANCWASPFTNNSKYQITFCNSENPLKNIYAKFSITNINGTLGLSTNEAFFTQITSSDSTLKLIIRPYIIPQQNVIKTIFSESNAKSFETLEFDESFKVENKYYILTNLNLSSKTISLKSVSNSMGRLGYKIGKFVNDFEKVKNQLNKSILNATSKIPTTGYYIIYFWGEWCQPCLKKIDYNKSLFSKLDLNKVNLINIALSMTEESELKTIDLIQKKQIDGFHIIETKKSLSNGLIQKLNISTYPSYVILDNKGKVAFRTDSIKERTIEEFLKENHLFKN
jgi:thiol-disulfide isomerase/thioredoxin